MNAGAKVEGWCPGALRPMETGDGLIVRLRLSCGELSPSLAADIADWADAFGNGQIDLSARANLQLRGVSYATQPPLLAALAARGLLDANAEAEAVRNVLVSPFAGVAGPLDLRPIARALEAELSSNARLWKLPGKFGFSLDAGPYPLGELGTDVAFEAIDASSFCVRLAGASASPLGPVAAETLVAVAVAVAEAFLALEPTSRRMREAVGRFGIEALGKAAGLAPMEPSIPRQARPLADLLSVHESFASAALPFGRIHARDLRTLGSAGASLRLTPWRIILALADFSAPLRRTESPPTRMNLPLASALAKPPPPSWGRVGVGGSRGETLGAEQRAGPAPLPNPPPRGGRELARALSATDLILDANDPRLRIAACPGAPACNKATMETRATATALAQVIARAPGSGLLLHISGCAKGCAHPARAPYTIIADSGTYALIHNGRAGDTPTARGLSRDALRAALEGAS